MIASMVLRRIDTMFGMQDPSQTLHQIERYMQEGRLELSEVMATQFCDMMLAKKNGMLSSKYSSSKDCA